MAQDPVADYLRKTPTSPAQRAELWEVFKATRNRDELSTRLQGLKVPDVVKAQLWEMKTADVPVVPPSASPVAPQQSLGRRYWDKVNPVAAIQAMGQTVIPEFAARALGAGDEEAKQYGPLNLLVNDADARGQVFYQAQQAYDKGDYGSAAIKTMFGLIPLLGPEFNQMGDNARAGKWGEALTDVAALGTNIAAPVVASKVPRVSARVGRVLPVSQTPEELAAVQFGRQRGIPVDAGTATGNRYVQGVQGLADHSPLGAIVAERARNAQGQALRRVGDELAEEASPVKTSPVAAVERVQGVLDDQVRRFAGDQDVAYSRLRDFEAKATPEQVPVRSAAVPTDPKALERSFILRWLADDLTEMPYQASSRMRGQQAIDTMEEATSQEAGRRAVYSPRVAGSPVQDTLNLAGISGTKAELANRITKQLQTGKIDPKLSKVADAYAEAWDGQQFDFARVSDATLVEAGLMRRGMRSPITMPDVSEPGASRFFPTESLPEVPKPVAMASQRFAMDMRDVKAAMKSVHQELIEANQSVPFMDKTGNAMAKRALDKLMNGPDFLPLSTADRVLGELKAMARTSDLPELRNQGQGVAALAVKKLDGQLKARAEQLGPEVLQALEDGRAATVAKYRTDDVRQLLGVKAEPRAIFDRLTASDDGGLKKLREVRNQAPGELPVIGRALLEDILDKPRSQGGFDFADRAWADWQKVGSDTRKLLFPKPGQSAAIDQFFLLAKRMGQSPNASKSGLIVNAGGQTVLAVTSPMTGVPLVLGSGALSKILHNPTAVQFLTRGMRISLDAKPGTQVLAASQVVRAAKEAGVVIPFPQAAEAQTEPKR